MLVKCNCQICSEHLEFESSISGQTIACPHCGMDTTLYIQNIPKPVVRIVSKQEVPPKSAPHTKIQNSVFLKPIIQNLLWFVVGAAVMLLLVEGGRFHLKKATENRVANNAENPTNKSVVRNIEMPTENREAAKVEKPVEKSIVLPTENFLMPAKLISSFPESSLHAISIAKLWADTETYFDKGFIVYGKIRIASSSSDDLQSELHYEEKEALGPDRYYQLVIDLPGKDYEPDKVIVFASKELAGDLVEKLTAKDGTGYSGYFLMKIPEALRYLNKYKRNYGDERIVGAELFAFAATENKLRSWVKR